MRPWLERCTEMATDEEDRKLRLAYKGMLSRCYNSKGTGYANYGGRGIFVCEQWLASRDAFIVWGKANGHKMDLTLDRIDVNGGYSPNNCRWITIAEQLRNQRRNRRITLNGTTLLLVEWAECLGLKTSTLSKRLNRMPPERAMKIGSLRPEWRHGTRHGYDAVGCRCPECKSAHAERHRLMRLRRKARREAA